MRDINIGGRDVTVKNEGNVPKDSQLAKIVLGVLTLIGVVLAALLGSQWLPQIWDKIRSL